MAESVSQLQAKLKALTHGKVDIMADANTYKNTTQILREMSAAWEDMTDKERAAALELMGGKRQANILASVIKNFDTVEKVIQTSTNSQGSALKENEKAINSIQGKMDKFSNSLQTFWNNMLNSNVIKGFVEFGTNVIKFLDTIPGKLTAIAAIIAGLIKFKGFNVFGAGKTAIAQLQTYQQALYKLTSFKSMNLDIGSTGNFNTQAVNAYAAAVQGLTAKTQAQMLAAAGLNEEQTKEILTVNHITAAEQNEALVKANLTNSTRTLQTARVADVITTDMAANKNQEAAISAFLAENANKKLSIALLERAVETGALSAEQAAQIASDYALTSANMTLASSFKAVGAAISMAFSTNPVGMTLTIITAVISLISLVGNLTESTEDLIQKGEEAKNQINEISNSFKESQKTVSDSAARFAQLSQGIDLLTGKNLSLSTDDYNEFLDLSNQLAEIFPTLSRNYDENGNAIVQLSGDTDTMVGSLKNLLEVQRQIANQQIAEKLPDLYKGVKAKSDQYSTTIDNLKKQQETYSSIVDAFQQDIEIGTEIVTTTLGPEANTKIRDLLDSFGLITYYDYTADHQSYTIMDLEKNREILRDHGNEIQTQLKQIANGYATELNTVSQKIQTKQNENKANWSGLTSSISAWLSTESEYQILSDDMQSAVQSIINSLDFTDLNFDSWEDAETYIKDNILSKIDSTDTELISKINNSKKAISDAISSNNEEDFKEAQQNFDNLIPDKWVVDGKIEIKDDDDEITKYIKGLAQQIETEASNYEVRLSFKEDFKKSSNYVEQAVQDKYKEYQALAEARTKIASLLPDEYRYFGNVDQYNRKIIPITDNLIKELKKKGLGEYTKDELGSYMTTFGMQDFVKEGQLAGQQIMFTPILPSGEILDRDTLDKYISEITKGASSESEVLEADKKGIQIGDTFVQGIVNGVTNINDDLMNPILDSIFDIFDKKNITSYDKNATEYGENVKSIVSDALISAFEVTDTGAKTEIRDAVANMLQEAVDEAGSDVDVKTLVDSNFQEIATTVQAIQLSYAQHNKQASIYDKEYGVMSQVAAAIDSVNASELLEDSGFADGESYMRSAVAFADSSAMIATAYQSIVKAFAGSDDILETDELIDAYKQWENTSFERPEGTDWTDDQYASLQLLRGACQAYSTDINTLAQSFVDIGLAAQSVDFDISEALSDNTTAIDTMQESISNYQSAMDKLSSGSATMSDIVDILQQYPKAAKGIKVTSRGVEGLYGSLRRAAKAQPKELINSLQATRKQLQALGKDTSEIDGLITVLDQLPSSGVDDLSDQFVTLADGMDAAKEAYGKLQEAMNKNPNVGYETRAEAIDKMKELMEDGQIGSTSELWDIAKAFFGDDPDKFAAIANKDADALYELIHAREAWYKTDDDGNLTYEGTESFIKSAEAAFNSSSKLKELGAKWTYDNGELNFDFGNADWDIVVSELSKTKELSGLTSAEFADLIVQVGQYFKLWEDADDVSTYIKAINDSSEDATVKMEKMTDAVESYYKKMTGEDIDLSTLNEAGINALNCSDDIKELLRTYLDLSDKFKDPLKIETSLNQDGLDGLTKIKEIQDTLRQNSDGTTVVNTDKFTEVLKEAGYTETQIDDLIKKIQEYDNVLTISNNDPLGFKAENANLVSVRSELEQLGIKYTETKNIMEQPTGITINAPDLITTLQSKGWTESQIRSYLTSIIDGDNGLSLTLDGQVIMKTDQIDEAINKSNELSEDKNTPYFITGTGESTLNSIASKWQSVTSPKSTTYSIYETTYKQTIDNGTTKRNGSGKVNGTAHVNGTAFSSGSWGAPKTETALGGELGPEILVRNGKWQTIGENGAEFFQVQKGDIIFNHKQTEELLANGYVTSRGKSYAEGTAYLSGSGRRKTYTFSTSSSSNSSSDSSSSSSSSDVADNMSDAADSANDFEETFDWVEVKLEEVNNQLDLMNAKLENAAGYSAQNSIIDQMIDTNNSKLKELEKGLNLYKDYSNQLLYEIPSQYREMAKNGSIAITEFAGEADEKTVEAINNYREWAQKVADLKQQLEETKTELRDLATQKFDNVKSFGEARIAVEDSQTEKLQDAVDLLEEKGLIADQAYYIAMMENSNKKIEYQLPLLERAQRELDDAVRSGRIVKGTSEWYDLVDQMYEMQSVIDGATIELEEYQNAINDLYWDNFDELINRLDYLKDETKSLIDLMDESSELVTTPKDREFWGEKDVQWTKEGITSLGLYAQQMEIAEYQSKQYEEAINDLNKDYKDGKYSETEYLDKLNELKSAQYDAIGTYYDAQEAIKSLNETRVESIKKGIEKEIDAYEKLIDKKKEELDTEKDLYDFQKSTMEQQKDIADIQRKIAALSTDNSASAVAKRKQLEADLAEAKSALEESYYNRSIDQRQEALDKELKNFQDEKNAEIEKWDKYLDQIEVVVADSLKVVQDNASLVYDTLSDKANEYNLTLSDSILTPWQHGALAISDYQSVFDTALGSTTYQLETLKNKWQEVIDKMAEAGIAGVEKYNKENNTYIAANKDEPQPTKNEGAKTIRVGSKINAQGAKIYSYAGGQGSNQYFDSDPIYTVLDESNGYYKVRWHKSSSGVTGWFRKGDVKAYAKGSKGIDKDQWALLDELGPELQLVPDGNGRLAYVQRGTSIIPSDISENLMKLGQLDPQDVLDRNRPQIGVPHITNNEISINMDIAEVVHVDKVTNDTLPDLAKVVEKQMDSYMTKVNNSLKKYTR